MLIFDPYRDKLAYVINYQKVHFLIKLAKISHINMRKI